MAGTRIGLPEAHLCSATPRRRARIAHPMQLALIDMRPSEMPNMAIGALSALRSGGRGTRQVVEGHRAESPPGGHNRQHASNVSVGAVSTKKP